MFSEQALKSSLRKIASYMHLVGALPKFPTGIGFSSDPMNKDHFKYTYENAEGFSSFPTLSVLCGGSGGLENLMNIPGMVEFNPMMLLHGEEKVEFFRSIQPDMKVTTKGYVADIADKGKGALLTIKSDQKDEEGNLLSITTMKVFIRGIGGFGDKGKLKDVLPSVPKRSPDHSSESKTTPNQAILYRLCGDLNPLHVDPDMAAMGNFEKPILHGLCTYGFSAREILEKYAGGDANGMKSLSARFTSHVFPGETLVVDMFKEGNNVIFATKTKERGLVVVQGVMELKPLAKL
jgi:acyl dehydratase